MIQPCLRVLFLAGFYECELKIMFFFRYEKIILMRFGLCNPALPLRLFLRGLQIPFMMDETGADLSSLTLSDSLRGMCNILLFQLSQSSITEIRCLEAVTPVPTRGSWLTGHVRQ